MGQMLRLWGGHFDCGMDDDYGLDVSNVGRRFDYGVDVSTMGGRFGYGADTSTVGRTFRLTLGWTFRLWGGHFDCGMGTLTVGWMFRLRGVYGHWGGRFEP